MSRTQQNLLEAFAGESQANRKYLAYAKQAEKEGLLQVAKLFRAVAEAETVHAHSHLRTLGKIGSTEENLTDAIAGETYEFKTMYPGMIRTAAEEGDMAAERSFSHANAVEIVHSVLYKKALANPGELDPADYYVCSVCGYTRENEPPAKCPVCNGDAKAFSKVD
jgi:rubrerythrin